MKESVSLKQFDMDESFARNVLHACSSKLIPFDQYFPILKTGLEKFKYFSSTSQDFDDIHDARDLCVLLVDAWALSQLPKSVFSTTSADYESIAVHVKKT